MRLQNVRMQKRQRSPLEGDNEPTTQSASAEKRSWETEQLWLICNRDDVGSHDENTEEQQTEKKNV